MLSHARRILILSIATTLLSCQRGTNSPSINFPFRKPVIVNQIINDTLKYFESEGIGSSCAVFAGKYGFTDTLLFSKETFDKRMSVIDPFKATASPSDSLQSDGFEIIPDYSSDVYNNEYNNKYTNYYPVYAINQTPLTKMFTVKDSRVFGIQEAIDPAGQWRPIEGFFFDFCGSGYWRIEVHPQEFITVLFPKYKGEYKTRIRVRLKIGNTIYVSKGFEGRINEKQLYTKKDSNFFKDLMQDKPAKESLYGVDFYGAEPLVTNH